MSENPVVVGVDGSESAAAAAIWAAGIARRYGAPLELVPARHPDVTVRDYLEPEAATKALLRHAGEAQLVVVGGRRRAAVLNTLLGSTSLNLLHHCPVPVMVCHR